MVDSAHATSIQIRERGGAPYVMNAPTVVGESLSGNVWKLGAGGNGEWSSYHVALAVVEQVAVRKLSASRTAVVILAVPLLGFVAFVGHCRAEPGRCS
jgi:hypothetical protein